MPGTDSAPVDAAATASPEPPIAPEPTPQADGPDPFGAAPAAQQHAEDLQRQHAQRQQAGLGEPEISPDDRQAIDQYVDFIPNLSRHQARFQKEHPSLMQPPYLDLKRHAILIARHAGIKDDTAEMDRRAGS